MPTNFFHPEWIKVLRSDGYELIGDCYLHTDSAIEENIPAEEPIVEGSLPFEILGARYWRKQGMPMRETVMLI